MGTAGADLKVRVFYDLLCPDSRAAYYKWKDLLPKESKVAGKTYGDLVDIHVLPYVLPYHLHSYTHAQVVPYLQDTCSQDSSKCFVQSYAEYCWKDLEKTLVDWKTDKDQMIQRIATDVAGNYDLPKVDIVNLFG